MRHLRELGAAQDEKQAHALHLVRGEHTHKKLTLLLLLELLKYCVGQGFSVSLLLYTEMADDLAFLLKVFQVKVAVLFVLILNTASSLKARNCVFADLNCL